MLSGHRPQGELDQLLGAVLAVGVGSQGVPDQGVVDHVDRPSLHSR